MTSDTGELRRLIEQYLVLKGWKVEDGKWTNTDYFARNVSLSFAAKAQLAADDYVSSWPGGDAA